MRDAIHPDAIATLGNKEKQRRQILQRLSQRYTKIEYVLCFPSQSYKIKHQISIIYFTLKLFTMFSKNNYVRKPFSCPIIMRPNFVIK